MRTLQTVHTLIYEKYWMCNQWDGYSTIHYSRVQYSTIQYCTVQYNTMLYSTVRYITPGEETTHTITHRPTISLSLCSVTMLPLCPVSPPPPPHRSKDQGWSFYILVLLEKNTFERKLRNLANLPHFLQFLYNKKKRWRWKFFVHRFSTKNQKNTVHRSFPFRNDHPWSRAGSSKSYPTKTFKNV